MVVVDDVDERFSMRTYLVQLKAGMAYPFSLAWVNNFIKLSPVTTPGGTISEQLMVKEKSKE